MIFFSCHPGLCSSAGSTRTPGTEGKEGRFYRPAMHGEEKPDEPAVMMPEVKGKSETEATSELQRAGIPRWKIVEVQSRSDNDTIIRQEPQAGGRVNMKAEYPAVIFVARPLITPLPLSSPGTPPLPAKAKPGVMVWPVIIVSQVLALFLVACYLKNYRLLVAETEDSMPAQTSPVPAFPAKRTALHLPAPEGEALKTGGPTQMPKEEVADWLLKLMKPEKAARKAEEDIANAPLPRGLENPLVKKPPEGSRKKTGLTAFLDELASSEKPAQKTQQTSPQPAANGGEGISAPSLQAINEPVISPARETPEPREEKTAPLMEPPVTPVSEVRDPREKKTVHLNEFLDKMSGQDAQKLAGTPFDRLIQKRISGPVKPSSKKSEEHIAPNAAIKPDDSAS